jgi:predicted secreted hydrolase
LVIARIATLLLALLLAAAGPVYPEVRPGATLTFPRDHGAHPAFRTEWWYVTGWLDAPGGPMGFQVTFFRHRPEVDQRNPSAFAAKQVMIAHAALSDPRSGKLLHDGRAARQGFGLASASVRDADVRLRDWHFVRGADGRFGTTVRGREFALELSFTPTQPVLLQGERGYSRKGPQPSQASYYYTMPQLRVRGWVVRDGRRTAVTGRAWLDREWSSTILDPKAVGWDWTGINFEDGGALTAFRVRGRDGAAVWAGGSYRDARGRLVHLREGDVRVTPVRRWRSPRTGAVYPVEVEIAARLPGGERRWRLKPLFDDQELDSRATGGPVYWEGAVRTQGGRGYLELTGYAQPLTL